MATGVKVARVRDSEESKAGRKMSRRDQKTFLNNALPTLAKLPHLERTGSPVSHSRWAAMASDTGGTATSISGETLLLHNRPICQDATIVQLKPDLQPNL